MYSKDELKQLKHDFWEGFGAYAATVPALARRKSKFMLYNTKMRGVELKFDATRKGASAILEINHHSEAERLRVYEHFERYKVIMEQDFPEGLVWDFAYVRESGQCVCRIYACRTDLDLHRREQWPAFYEYMVSAMLRLERAFCDVKDTF